MAGPDPYGGAGPYGANRYITDQPMGGMGAPGLAPWDYQVPMPQMPAPPAPMAPPAAPQMTGLAVPQMGAEQNRLWVLQNIGAVGGGLLPPDFFNRSPGGVGPGRVGGGRGRRGQPGGKF